MIPRFKNDNQSRQFRNQRTVNVAGARENVGSPVVQQSGIQCFNCKEFGFTKLEAHYSYMAKIQEVPTADTSTDSKPVEHVQNDVGYNVFSNDLKHSEQSEYELKECKTILAKTSNALRESISIRDSCLVALQTKQNEFEKLIPDGEETLALKRESQSKLNKNLVHPYDYTTLNSLYEIFKPPTQEFEIQL
nr:hypothetical protein [Tanacetum cinerariifolium]